MIWPLPNRCIASPGSPPSSSARPRSADETRKPLAKSKIQNPQSSFINPLFPLLSEAGACPGIALRSRVGDPENGGRFTVKKYHSAKTVSEDVWQHDRIEVLPLNPDYAPIPVAPHEGPEMVVVGEWVASIH